MEIYKLKNVDPHDIDGVLLKIQRSFNIKLDNDGLKNVDTLGSLRDLIINKISLDQPNSCTTQQAFYKLRNAIASTAKIDKCSVKPQTKLSEIFPKDSRLEIISEIENELGYKINLLRPRQWIVGLFALLLVCSLIACCFTWQIGIFGIVFSLTSLKLAGKFGKEMHLKTVGDLACKISRESYLKSRHNEFLINKGEIEQKLKELFADDFQLDPVMLTRRSTF
jgi:acyl carrier protein